MKPVAITFVDPLWVCPKLVTCRPEIAWPAAFAALAHAASGESFTLPCSPELGTRLEDTYAIFQPAFAEATTLTESMLSREGSPPKDWLTPTAWSFLLPRSGSTVTSRRPDADVPKRALL